MEANKIFYRIANHVTHQGLWYDCKGTFTGLIHNEFNFCQNTRLQMPFDKNIIGFLSATDSIDDLYNWFSVDDILRLEKYDYFITVYEATNYKFHNNHWVICQDTSKLLRQLQLVDVLKEGFY